MTRAKTVVHLSGQITLYETQGSRILNSQPVTLFRRLENGLMAELYASSSKWGPWLEYLPSPAMDINLT